jgi:hypothetical protein
LKKSSNDPSDLYTILNLNIYTKMVERGVIHLVLSGCECTGAAEDESDEVKVRHWLAGAKLVPSGAVRVRVQSDHECGHGHARYKM